MKPTRIFATASLIISSVALITAASVSVGDEPGVVRMATLSPQEGTANIAPTPDPTGTAGVATMTQPPGSSSPYPEPDNYAPYFERSFAATEAVPNASYQAPAPFGPIMMFETNLNSGLGYQDGYQRINARVPYHIIPNTNVLIGDMSAAVTWEGAPVANGGLVYRRYDDLRNRVFGVNTFIDYDQGYGNSDWYRGTVGVESLGQYVDFRANGYFILGDDSTVLSDAPSGNLFLGGNNVFRTRTQVRENAYSGFDAEVGGPLPVLGQYGLNMYVGGYLLGNDNGYDTVGFQARWEALITQNLTVNTYLTSDDTFGTNSWVGLQYELPNYKTRRTLRPRAAVRERLQDPVVRSTRIHTNIDTNSFDEVCINDVTSNPYFITYVDPNINTPGTGLGTLEDPFRSMAALTNNAGIDIIRVTPNSDGSGSDLTVNGGLSLFNNQALISSNTDYELFRIGATPFYIPGTGATGPGPLLTRPNIGAGESIVRLANNNTISGMQFDASNAAGTVFGNGVSNLLPITGLNLTNNTFSNYVVGADLTDVSGRVIVNGNTFTGRSSVAAIRSDYGMKMNVAANQTMDLLLDGNAATTNRVAGLSVTASLNSTLNADDPDGNTAFVPPATGKYVYDQEVTGITNNVLTGNGNGIEVIGQTGSTINAVVEDNVTNARHVGGGINVDAQNGILARTDGGTFNLASLRNNTTTGQYDANSLVAPVTNENGVLLHYRNGGTFLAQSEDVNEDKNFNGVLDAGEDLDGDAVLDVANGILDAGEDLNGNGILDQGIVSNVFQNNVGVGLCIFGETAGVGGFMIGGPVETLGNTARNNGNAGIAMDLNGTAIASVDSMFNTITDNAFARTYTNRVQANFAMTGDTFGATAALTNLSSAGDITQFSWDLNLPAGTQDYEFDTTEILVFGVNTGPGSQFTPLNNSDLTTGLAQVNGLAVPPYNAALQNALDNGQSLLLNFTNDPVGAGGFDVNESFAWSLDIDPNTFTPDIRPDDVVNANVLAGTAGSITFRDDFSGNGVQSTRTLAGLFTQSATDPLGLELNFDETFTAPIFDTAAGRAGDGFRVQMADNSQITHFNSINDTISRNKGNGLSLVANDNAIVDALTIQGATIEQNQGRGINIEARDNAVINANSTIGGFDPTTLGQNIISGTSFTEANVISRNGSDGIRVLASGNGVVNGNLINNTIEENLGDGAALVIDNGGTLNFGNLANNEVISRNTIRANNGAGLRLVSNVSPSTTGVLNALVQGNTISANAGGGIVSQLSGLHNAPPTNNTLNLTVSDAAYIDRTAEQNRNFITNNGDVGIGVDVGGNGFANVNLSNVSVTGTFDGADPLRNGDGIALTRSGASLLTATLSSVDVTGNAGDGLLVDAQGNDKTDPKQPDSGTPNMVTVTDSNFSSNGLNGAQFRVRGNATLIGDVSQSTFSNNGENGILVQTSQGASFGDPTIGLPPGRRSIFDGNTINNNGVDGVLIFATDNSRALVEITSNLAPVVPSPHAAASTLGATSLSGNGHDGVHIITTGGRSDILITSGTATTTIAGNGTVIGGSGIGWDASGTSEGVVRVTKTRILNNIAGASEDTNGNGVLDAGEDLNGNGDIDVAEGDGIQANFSGNATATLIVGNAGEGNIIQNNDDDGIAITATGSNLTGNPRPIITITDNIIGGTNNGLEAGNGGDGVSLQLFGGTRTGLLSGTVDNDANGDGFIDAFITDDGTRVSAFHVFVNDHSGVTESGAIPQFTMTGNVVTNNAQRGVNILLNGAGGVRDRENGNSDFDPIRITLDNNEIAANGAEGVYYRADADMNQSRFVYLANFPDPPIIGLNNQNFSPFRPEFQNLNVGSVNGNTAYLAPWLNLRTVQNSLFTLTNNTIQNNGTNGVTGEGVRMEVGTSSYVAADIRNNTFGGNLEEDLVTSSFLSSGNTENSVNTSGDLIYDYVYLDDTAQLDLRFLNNAGNEIAVTDLGAVYTNADPVKFFNRDASLFQVDNGPNLNNPNNTFINFGVTQDIQNAFSTGGYNLRAIADPAFPNIGFAPFLP